MEIILDEKIKSVTSIDELSDRRGINYFPLGEKDNNFIYSTLKDSDVTHTNYLEYLEKCWQKHFNAVVRPDFIWHVIACELAIHIKNNAEKYRNLFTDSDKKKEITVLTLDPIVLPIDLIVNELHKLVPFNTDAFMPKFTTTTQMSTLAFGAALCDAMSPYYNYSMYMCGIPKLKLEGTVEDWKLLQDSFNKIAEVLDIATYQTNVNEVINNIIKSFDNTEENNVALFNKIIKLTKCGSGSQYTASGWITKLFMKQPSLAKTENFSSCVSDVEYKNITTNKDYIMKVGLLSSKFEDEYLVPEFNYIIYDKTK